MASETQRGMIREIAELRRRLSSMVRMGTVHEVKKDKLRMIYGVDNDGQPVLSPWLYTNNHRGGAREARFYKKGQNVTALCPGGDWEKAVITPYSPNKDFLRPDHANKSGQDEETFQLDDLRVKKTKDGYDIWLQPPNQKQQQKGDVQKLPDQQDSGTVKSKIRLHKNGGITGRIGTNMRFAAHEKGVKIKAAKKYAIFVDDKGCWSTHPIQQKKDPIPDDDD